VNVVSIDDNPSDVIERGVVAKSCIVAKRCVGVVAERCIGVVAKRCVGVVAEHCVGVVAKSCVVAECCVVAERCVVAECCIVAEHGVVADIGIVPKSGVVTERIIVAERGIITDSGIEAKKGIVARGVIARGVVEVDAVDGVTTKRRFVGVGSTDPTFARLPKEAVKDDFRFLPAWTSVDAAVRGNRSGANTDRSRWLVRWTWRIMSDNISNPDAIRGSKDTRNDGMLRQRRMVGNRRDGR
jgi:hypothetical protein